MRLSVLALVVLAACGGSNSGDDNGGDSDTTTDTGDADVGNNGDTDPGTGPVDTKPTAPLTVDANTVQTITPADGIESWYVVPSSYDATHNTPITLLVWMHGCGGQGQYDVENVSPGMGTFDFTDTDGRDLNYYAPFDGSQTWISLSLGGTEDHCWDDNGATLDMSTTWLNDAIDALETHFNINRSRVFLSGYSSGGDLLFHAAFSDNASRFAGLLVINSSPFGDSSRTLAQATAAPKKLPIYLVGHYDDDTYPICDDTVANGTGVYPGVDQWHTHDCIIPQLQDLQANGYTGVTYDVYDGGHYNPNWAADDAGNFLHDGDGHMYHAIQTRHRTADTVTVLGTDWHVRNYLLPKLNDASWVP